MIPNFNPKYFCVIKINFVKVMSNFFNYLKEYAGVDRVIYALDPDDGIDLAINMQTWWQKNLRDSKNIKDGFLLFVAGPTPPEVI